MNSVIESPGLQNATAQQIRAVGSQNIAKKQINAMPNGIIYLKGGDITQEVKPFKNRVFVKNLSDWFEDEYFETKKVVHLPV